MARTDRYALITLYKATDGPSWKNSTSWNTDADLSEWHGVKLSGEGRVTDLSLNFNNLRGPIPPELGNLEELKSLWLYNNELTGPIPPELGKLGALQDLQLWGNTLSGSIPRYMGNLTKLDVLRLDFNQLSGTVPKELGMLTALKTLYLNSNNLSGLWVTLGQDEAGSMATRPGILPVEIASLLDGCERLRGRLRLDNNPWEHPPEPIVTSGMPAVRKFFEAMNRGGATAVTRPLKVVIVGKDTVGKTSLRRSIGIGRPSRTKGGDVESTGLVDVEDLELEGRPIRVFDCAGQVVNLGLLQLFLAPRALYLLVWDAAEASEMEDLNLETLAVAPWLRYLASHVPGANVILVGNKWDRVARSSDALGVEVDLRSRQWLSRWLQGVRRRQTYGLVMEAGVSLTSCAPSGSGVLARSLHGGAGTGWPCDRSPPGLLRRIVHNTAGGMRAVTMCLPPSYQLALDMLDELPWSNRREAEHQTPGMTRASLEEKWLAKVDELKRAGTPVAAPESAMSGAILIRKWEGGLVEYGSYILLDVQWFATVLDPLFSHKRDFLGNIDLGGRTVKNTPSFDRLDKAHILEPQLAEELWGAELAPHLLLALKSAGLTFPLPNDPNGGLVILSRMDAEPPADYSKKLNSQLRRADRARKHDLRLVVECAFRLGLPPGFVDRLLARCCHLGFPFTFWRYGVLIMGDSAEKGLFSMSLEYSENNRTLRAEVYGGCQEVHAWGALSKVLSVMIKMLAEFPGLPCQASFYCPLHKHKGMPVRTTDAPPGSRLVEERSFCPLCQERAAGIDLLAVALQVVRFSDEKFFDAGLCRGFAENAKNVALQSRAPWPGVNFEGEDEEKDEPGEEANDEPDEGEDKEEPTEEEKDEPVEEEEKNEPYEQGVGWTAKGGQFAKEAPSGVDRLDYDVYAAALAGLFRTGETEILPAAVGIYAPWGSGKSFLLDQLKSRLQERDSQAPRSLCATFRSLCATFCCCLPGLLGMILHNVVFVIAAVIWNELRAWLRSCFDALRHFGAELCEAFRHSNAAIPKALVECFRRCRAASCRKPAPASPAAQPAAQLAARRVVSSDVEASLEEDISDGREFVVVEFNAWECAGLEILWAVVTTKIFDAVEGHPAFGRGAVRAARIKKLLNDPSWSWCGLASFYFTVALLGIVVVLVLKATGYLDGIDQVVKDSQWVVATVILPTSLSLLNILAQMRSRGSLRTAQSALRKAISKRESVGEAYRGFMSEVKEELETLFHMINTYNSKLRQEREDKEMKKMETATPNEEENQNEEAKQNEEPRQNEEAEQNGQAKQIEKKTLALAVIVDDLDRCSKEKIMEMLKATHLLLEQPNAPMAVFLAVDPQLIVSAIAESLEGVPNTMRALQYLDKIIHLPFCIPPLSATKKLSLLDSLLNASDNSCHKTLERVKKFLNHAPTDDRLKACEEEISGWCPQEKVLDKAALELVCTLHWWSQPECVVKRSWSTEHCDALESFRTGLEKDSKAALGIRRAACFKLLEGLCCTINTLMSEERGESSKAENTTTPLDAEEGATSDVVAALHRLPVDSTPAPFSGQSIPSVDGGGESAPRTDGNGLGGEAEAATDDGVGGAGVSASHQSIPPGDVGGETAAQTHGEGHGDEAEAATYDGSDEDDAAGDAQPPRTPLQTFNRAISKGENDTFRVLFKIVRATPRKTKRVVNVYFLQRSLAEHTDWWNADPAKKELVTWTILAEFWPFRLSCIAFAMTNGGPQGKPPNIDYTGDATIVSVYFGDYPSTSVCKWIDDYRGTGTPKDLFLSDDTEGRFRDAINAGAQITKKTVEECLLHNSFNLNPAIMSTIEVEMVYDLPQTAES